MQHCNGSLGLRVAWGTETEKNWLFQKHLRCDALLAYKFTREVRLPEVGYQHVIFLSRKMVGSKSSSFLSPAQAVVHACMYQSKLMLSPIAEVITSVMWSGTVLLPQQATSPQHT